MQYDPIEIRAQQVVLAFLGYYNGAIDGIWSAATINAMQKFECADEFLPAVPTGGLPFPANSRLPKGMYWDKRTVSHRSLTPEKIKEILDRRSRTVQSTPLSSSNATSVPTPNATPTATTGIADDEDDFVADPKAATKADSVDDDAQE